MEITTYFLLLVFIIVSGIAVFMGLDLKKASSWLFGLCGYLCGFLVGVVNTGMIAGLQLGVVFAFIIMFGGAMMRWHQRKSK